MQKFRGSLESLTQNYSVCVCVCVCVCVWARVHVCVRALSRVQLLATSWTAARQAPLSLGFPRQEYWRGLPFPPLGDVPNPGIEPGSPGLQADSPTPLSHWGSTIRITVWSNYSTSGYIHQSIESKDSNRSLFTNVHSSVIHNCQQNRNNPNVHQLINGKTKRGIPIQWTIIIIQS